MNYYEQSFTPFMVTPTTWSNTERFTELALHDGICLECFAPVGYSTDHNGTQVWHDYWVIDEDMETVYCPPCYEELTKEI
jgi:hypothetical protein